MSWCKLWEVAWCKDLGEEPFQTCLTCVKGILQDLEVTLGKGGGTHEVIQEVEGDIQEVVVQFFKLRTYNKI